MKKVKVGVLALQGAFSKHLDMLKKIGAPCLEVRTSKDLAECRGLIIPGGESTTMTKLLQETGLFGDIQEFSREKPIFGTCAGLILMSKEVIADACLQPFHILDVALERNAFGRQAESFSTVVEVALKNAKPLPFPALFIRAPRIQRCGSGVKVLARYGGEPILIREGNHLGATFHPELSNNPLIHEYFLSLLS